MVKENTVYRELQQHLDSGPAGFQPSETGTDIQLLKHLLTPEEARIATLLSTMKWEPAETIYRRVRKDGLDLTLEEFREKLDVMVRKGTILVHTEGFTERRYRNVGVSAGGMIDFQVNRLTKELIEDLDKYHEETFAKPRKPNSKPPVAQLRTVPVSASTPLPDRNLVGTYDSVRALVEQAPGPFSVANCLCRQMKDMQEQPCKFSDMRETCIQIGPDHARQYIEMGVGREISREEVFEILDKALEGSFILQPENSVKPENICCCCGDCCGPVSASKKMPRPVEMFTTNYYAKVDAAACSGCETCIARCPMEATKMADGIATIDLDRCIGCGNCVPTCPSGALQLMRKEQTQMPFRDKNDTFMHIMANKLSSWEMMKLRVKMMFGINV